MRPQDEQNSLAFWFPKIEAAGLPVPETHIVRAPSDMIEVLDGVSPEGWRDLIANLDSAGDAVGWPCFLRTAYGSGKHDWSSTCFVTQPSRLPIHVARLVEWSQMADMFGLPSDVWAVRKLIPTDPLFHCTAYGGMPVVPEWRLFVRDGKVDHVQPYWPRDAILEGEPDDLDWYRKLNAVSGFPMPRLWGELVGLAGRAVKAVGGGHWSVDLLQDAGNEWWVTDMALGDMSFRYEPEW